MKREIFLETCKIFSSHTLPRWWACDVWLSVGVSPCAAQAAHTGARRSVGQQKQHRSQQHQQQCCGVLGCCWCQCAGARVWGDTTPDTEHGIQHLVRSPHHPPHTGPHTVLHAAGRKIIPVYINVFCCLWSFINIFSIWSILFVSLSILLTCGF